MQFLACDHPQETLEWINRHEHEHAHCYETKVKGLFVAKLYLAPFQPEQKGRFKNVRVGKWTSRGFICTQGHTGLGLLST